MFQKSKIEEELNKLYKKLFDAQFIYEDEYAEQDIINQIRRLEEDESKMEAYRESVWSDGTTV